MNMPRRIISPPEVPYSVAEAMINYRDAEMVDNPIKITRYNGDGNLIYSWEWTSEIITP